MEATPSPFKIILGSSSVYRQKVLAEMGYDFTIMTADIDEKSIRREKPEELVMAIAGAKAEAIIPKLPVDYCNQDAETSVLITGDQVVVYEGKVREKPASKEEARQFIKDYSSGTAATVSSVLVTNLKTGIRKADWEKAEIHFHVIPDQVIDSLIEEAMVLNVAGALISEHPFLQPYVKQLATSCKAIGVYRNIELPQRLLEKFNTVGTTESMMGLPKALTERLIREVL